MEAVDKEDWTAAYRRLRWHQYALEQHLNKLQWWKPLEDDSAGLPSEDGLLEKLEQTLTSDLDLLRDHLQDEELDKDGNSQGGWSRREEQLLTRFLARGGSRIDLARAALLCGKSENEVREHLERLRRGRDKRRADVLRWKNERTLQKALEANQVSKDASGKSRNVSDETRQRICIWREEKEKRLREEKADREEHEERRREQVRRNILQWRQKAKHRTTKKTDELRQKTDEEEWRKVQEVEKALRSLSLARLRDRDEEIARKRRWKVMSSKSVPRIVKQSTTYQGTRDPERLFRPTTVWQERLKTVQQESRNETIYVLHLQKRTVPSWRILS